MRPLVTPCLIAFFKSKLKIENVNTKTKFYSETVKLFLVVQTKARWSERRLMYI